MKIKYAFTSWQIALLIAVLLISIFPFYGCENKSRLDIFINPQAKILHYTKVYIDVQCDGKRHGRATDAFQEVADYLNKMGLDIYSYSNIKTAPDINDLLFNCYITYGWGIPELTRHFDVEFRFPTTFNVEFRDARTKEILVKISYVRGFADEPYKDIDIIFTELKKKLIAAGSWTEPKK